MSKTPRRIAIVDDDPSVLKALKRILSTRSLTAKTYDSGPQFLASLAQETPDCLILDLHMPNMTGLELQQNLARRGIRIPTIFITAHSDAATRGRCEATGAVAFIAKPVPDDALFAAIEAAGGGSA
jgi:FixJ family two-component response regulator